MSKRGRRARSLIRMFVLNERGATAIEYALIGTGLACAIATTVFGTGSSLRTNFYGRRNAALTEP